MLEYLCKGAERKAPVPEKEAWGREGRGAGERQESGEEGREEEGRRSPCAGERGTPPPEEVERWRRRRQGLSRLRER